MGILSKLFGSGDSSKSNGKLIIIDNWSEADNLQHNQDFKLKDDNSNIIRIKQSPPDGYKAIVLGDVNVTGLHIDDREYYLRKLITGEDRVITLEREPNNPKDKNAIMVLAEYKEKGKIYKAHIGYIPKEDASELKHVGDLAATITTMFKPEVDRSAGIRIDIWRKATELEKAYEVEKQDIEQAIELYKSFIMSDPYDEYSYNRLAIIYRKQGLNDAEVAIIEEAIEKFTLLKKSSKKNLKENKEIIEKFTARLEKAESIRNNKASKYDIVSE